MHRIDVADHHGLLADAATPLGNGLLLWFEVADIDAAIGRVREPGAPTERGPEAHGGHPARRRPDPDGYLVVLAGPSEYRPR